MEEDQELQELREKLRIKEEGERTERAKAEIKAKLEKGSLRHLIKKGFKKFIE